MLARSASPVPRRGTTVLGGDEPDPTPEDKPWWRGAAVAAGGFALLFGLAVALNSTTGGDPASSADVPTPRTHAGTVHAGTGDGAGGDPRTSVHQMVDGVPVGYPHTEAGAVQAAVNYQVARSSPGYFTDAPTRHRIIRAMATSESRETLTHNDDAAMERVLASLGINHGSADTLVARAATMGTKIDSYSDQVATVEVWMAGLIGTTDERAPLPVSASWSTYTLTLQWQDGDWKLATVSSVPGPTPLDTGSSAPSSVDDFRAADQDFHAPPYVG